MLRPTETAEVICDPPVHTGLDGALGQIAAENADLGDVCRGHRSRARIGRAELSDADHSFQTRTFDFGERGGAPRRRVQVLERLSLVAAVWGMASGRCDSALR